MNSIVNRLNLALMSRLGDRAAQGRAYGNLGNTHYLLGNFEQAVTYHKHVSRIRVHCSLLISSHIINTYMYVLLEITFKF